MVFQGPIPFELSVFVSLRGETKTATPSEGGIMEAENTPGHQFPVNKISNTFFFSN